MIFKPELVEKILAGEKTVTRRRIKHHLEPPRYREGREYAVQPGRGKKAVARIRVKRVSIEPLGIIDPNEARLEGFATERAFKSYWFQLYGSFDLTQLVHRIEFELVGSA